MLRPVQAGHMRTAYLHASACAQTYRTRFSCNGNLTTISAVVKLLSDCSSQASLTSKTYCWTMRPISLTRTVFLSAPSLCPLVYRYLTYHYHPSCPPAAMGDEGEASVLFTAEQCTWLQDTFGPSSGQTSTEGTSSGQSSEPSEPLAPQGPSTSSELRFFPLPAEGFPMLTGIA